MGSYGKRNDLSSDITQIVIDGRSPAAHPCAMFSKSELLAKVEAAAASRAEIARVLNLAPARVTELYKDGRDLSFEEGRKLIRHYNLEAEAAERGVADFADMAAEHGISMVEEVDLALGLGAGYLDHPESKGFVPFKADWLRGLFAGKLDNLKVVRGRGDSMRPTILDDDVVLVDLSQKTIDDQDRLWAVAYGDLGMIKRVRQTSRSSYLLLSDNPVVPPIEAVDEEMHVLGRVIWIGRRM